MFVVTLSKASVKKLGVGAMCCALVVFSAMLGRYISTRSVAVAAASNKIESAQDIQTWFTGYGLDVDGASITADKVKIPRKWDDSFSAFNGVVQQSGMDLARYKGKTAVLDCRLGAHIAPEGFIAWNDRTDTGLASFAEADSTGPGAAERPAWVKQLSGPEAAELLAHARTLCRPKTN